MKVKSIIKLVLTLLLIAVLGLLAVYGFSVNGKTYIPKANEGIKFGLDIAGGTSILYEAQSETITAEEASTVINIMRSRLDSKGYNEATITREGDKRFAVEIPQVTDTQEIVKILGTTAKLQFTEPPVDETTLGAVVLEGKNIKSAAATVINDPTTNSPQNVVTLKFDDEGTKAFADATARLIGQPIIIMLDDAIISYPTVNEPITNGEAIISGDFTMSSARELASLINSGNLPVELKEISSNTVDATLGAGALYNAVLAGLISLIIIALYMIFFYRLPGLLASISAAILLKSPHTITGFLDFLKSFVNSS